MAKITFFSILSLRLVYHFKLERVGRTTDIAGCQIIFDMHRFWGVWKSWRMRSHTNTVWA